MRWAEHVASMAEKSGAYRVLVGKREGRRPLLVGGRPLLVGGRPLLVGGTILLEMYLKNCLGGRGFN